MSNSDVTAMPAEETRDPLIRVMPMPADSNPNGDIFGGWVLSQMDIAGALMAVQRARGRVATVAIDAMKFLKPVAVGDMVSIYGSVTKVGRTSVSIHLETYVRRRLEPESARIKVTEGIFTYVAIDSGGRKRPIP